MEVLEATYEFCRLCMNDLSDLPEYYAIDESLRDLIETLTGISVDLSDHKHSTVMCPSCYETLEQFNSAKFAWIDNQERYEEQALQDQQQLLEEAVEVEEEEKSLKLEYEVEEDEDSRNDFDYPVEYVEDLVEMTESDQMVESIVETKPDLGKKLKTKSEKSNNEKGKDVYQKLLKKCDECGKMIEKNRLDGHMNKHNGLRPYLCDVEGCDKTFYCKLLFRLHKTSIHTGILVTCEVCNKSFPSQRSLYAHSARHKNENRYNCDCCERKFNNSNSLKRHQAIHSGIREYKCENCSASFYRKFNLDVHVRTVHEKEKSFVCLYCPKKFGYSRLLRDHVKKIHAGKVDEFTES